MDAPRFYSQFLNASPHNLASYSYELQDLVRQYPWFALGHKLLFKSLCGLGGDAYLTQGEKAAAYMYSRAQLFTIQAAQETSPLAEPVEVVEMVEMVDAPDALEAPEASEAPETPETPETPEAPEAPEAVDALEALEAAEAAAEAKQLAELAQEQSEEPLAEPLQATLQTTPQVISREEAPAGARIYLVGGDYFSKRDLEEVVTPMSSPQEPSPKPSPIDTFIATRPRLSPLRDTPIEGIDVSEQESSPVLLDNNFVTETLARIYANQGHYKLALACYEKLILLYPKKSAYFAALIKEFKQKTNV